jgi:oligopeptide/dipeptide ABC transporter ATP-binding protein
MSGTSPHPATPPLIEVRDLVKHFEQRGGTVRAVDGVSFSVHGGETLALVGESGSGKTTVGRLVSRLTNPTAGSIFVDGVNVTEWNDEELRRDFRSQVGMIFQDPLGSLNPRSLVDDIIAEPLRVRGTYSRSEIRGMLAETKQRVGIPAKIGAHYPHELSAAERQRVGIAAALIIEPKLIVADEPVSALDVSMQAQILNVMMDLRAEMDLAYLFISHDLSVVRHVADRVAVMYLGKIVELASKAELFASPDHPYTNALLSSVPTPNPALRRTAVLLQGEIPSPISPPPGCRFHTRCPLMTDFCIEEEPELEEVPGDRSVACHFSPVRTPSYLSSEAQEKLEEARRRPRGEARLLVAKERAE